MSVSAGKERMSTTQNDTLETIRNWVSNLPGTERTLSQDKCFEAIAKAIKQLGYGYPFDQEQRKLNEMLLDSLAGDAACQTAWNYYHETKMIKAKSPIGRA